MRRRCGHAGSFNADSQAVDESIDELLAVLETMTYEVVCCRHVSHLTTASGGEVQIGDVTVVPEPEQWGGLVQRIQREIRGAPQAWNREDPRLYDPPHSLLIIRETTDAPDPYAVDRRLSWRLERFLLARLLTAGTVQSAYQVSGATTLIARMSPLMRLFRKGWLDTLVRRTVRLTGNEGEAFTALGDLIDATEVKREGMVAMSFDVALSKFNRSHGCDSPYEHFVDLATALEAVLIGSERDNEGLTLRLRTRVAARRAAWRERWHARLAGLGVEYAAGRPRSAVDSLSQEDR